MINKIIADNMWNTYKYNILSNHNKKLYLYDNKIYNYLKYEIKKLDTNYYYFTIDIYKKTNFINFRSLTVFEQV